jgi:DNA topoisomerase-1
MPKNLVIVESPAKAKTIEGYLGKDFTVKSSYGHVRDLVKSGMGINIKKKFEPVYEVHPDKVKVIDELEKAVKKADIVWLATDEDREGEAISWHLFETLGLKAASTRRIVFHEITRRAILEAIDNPRDIDYNLVDAQQARRILDRLVGFELSPILWKKVKPSLSAGRVQSVAVRLIVEREREIDAFSAASYFRVVGVFTADGRAFRAELPTRFKTREEAQAFLESCRGAAFQVSNLEVKPGKRSPSAPFTTSTLQQEASRKLGYSVSQTMVIAQKLYESGKITYMRTDSVTLSKEALDQAAKTITRLYGAEYSEPHQYKTKQASAQEAHEAIRPTDFSVDVIDADQRDQRLYDLIRKRTLASQMADAKLERTVVTVANDKNAYTFAGTGEVIVFDGFLKVYMESTDDETEDEDSGLLPPVKIGDALGMNDITATERFTQPPSRFTEASLVKKLEELGIGRPSTYSPTISTIQKRGYVVKEDRPGRERSYHVLTLAGDQVGTVLKTEITGAEKAKMFPTDIGTVVTDFLVQNFKDILDYNFTAYVEREFDDIANGQLKWNKMIEEFYGPFHKTVELTEKESERATGERILGKDPKSGLTVLVRIGRYGPMVQLGTQEETEKPTYSKLRGNQRLETISLTEALDLFRLPRNLGQYENDDVVVSIGRFGPYARHKDAFYSLGKEDDPYEIGLERAIEVIEARRKVLAERVIRTFAEESDVQVLKGRWGPYIAYKGKNLRIPKGTDAETLTLEAIHALASDESNFSRGRGFRRKAAAPEPAKAPLKAAASKKPGKAAGKKTPAKAPAKKAAAKKPAVKKKAASGRATTPKKKK